eukprot:COSAG04_NODE_938_length_9314_cov_3.854287_4_plen_288_part_00
MQDAQLAAFEKELERKDMSLEDYMKQVRTHTAHCARAGNTAARFAHCARDTPHLRVECCHRGRGARCVDSGRCLCSGLRCVRWTARSTSRRSPTSADACRPSPPKSTRDLCSIEEGRGMRSLVSFSNTALQVGAASASSPAFSDIRTSTYSRVWSGRRPVMIGALAPARPAARSPGRRPPWLPRCTRWPGTATAGSDYPRGRWPRESAAPAGRSRASRWPAHGMPLRAKQFWTRFRSPDQTPITPRNSLLLVLTTQRHQTPATTADQHNKHHQHHHNGHPVPRDDRR